MRSTLIVSVSTLAVLLMSSGKVAAQSSGSSSGLFGNVTTGTGLSPGTSSLFGSSGAGGSSGQGFNPSAAGTQAPTSTAGFIGANTAQTAQQSFVGAAQANANGSSQYGSANSRMGGMGGAGGMGGMGMGGMGMGGMGMGMGGMGMGGMGGARNGRFGAGMFGGNNTATTPQVRVTVTLGFEPTVAESEQFSSAVAEHLEALPALHWQGPAQVVMQGRTAILRGVVATEHDRELAERVVRLEPTVDQVQNQLVVASRATPKKAPTAGPGAN